MREKLLVPVVLAGVLAASGASAHSQTAGGKARAASGDYRVEPGHRLGKVTLGSPRAQVHRLLGTPASTELRADGLREDTWQGAARARRELGRHHLMVLYRNDEVVQVEASSPAFRTSGGLSTGTTFLQMVKRLPDLQVSQFKYENAHRLYYDDAGRGLAFATGASDYVLPEFTPDTVVVHRRGTPAIRQPDGQAVRPPDLDWTGAAFPYSRRETRGKSDAQILAMGRDRWFEFFTSGDNRDNSADQCAAEEMYGHALERRNNLRIGGLSEARRSFVYRIRENLLDFETNTIEAVASINGGGSTWKLVRAGIIADVEVVIGRLTGDRGPSPAARRTADVERRLDALQQKLQASQIPAGEAYSGEYGLKHLRQARETFQVLARVLKKATRAESDLVLTACIDTLDARNKRFGARPSSGRPRAFATAEAAPGSPAAP